jgi:hypothetical protein
MIPDDTFLRRFVRVVRWWGLNLHCLSQERARRELRSDLYVMF